MPNSAPAGPAGTDALWPAPTASGPVSARVAVPGSKSATNRALVLAALADGPSTLRRPLRSRDTLLMAEALRSLGARIDDADGEDGTWLVTPPKAFGGDVSVNIGNAGTVMRFVPALAPLANGPVRFDGDPRSHERPVATLIEALRALGADIDDAADPGHFPLTVDGHGALAGGLVEIDSSASSQFVSALLLAGARYDRGVEIRHIGGRLPSQPYIDMAVQMVRAAGVTVDDEEPERWKVEPGPIAGQDLTIEPDLSNAAPFLAAALVVGGSVTVPDWPITAPGRRATQPGDRMREIFTRMGARCELTADGLTVTGGDGLHGIDIDLGDEAELTPTVAALAALADSPSRLTGIGHIRLHETDRIAALAKEINNLGGDVLEEPEALVVSPRPLHGGEFASHDDHRMATAGALIGLAVPGVRVENVGTTVKTLPDFPGRWAAMLAGTEYRG
ncbi:MAG TPA: 3-phosphoshikimate 1-carboxyvinyltransferase [Actinocrinis sp.]